MNLIDENVEKESEEKQKKITRVIGATIAILIMIVIGIVVYAVVKNKNTLKLSVNGNAIKDYKANLFLMDNNNKNIRVMDNGQIYISVNELSNILGSSVEYYNDEYNGKGEDLTKCHIKTDNEYTSYISGSSTIYKVRDNKAENDEIRKKIKNSRNEKDKEELFVNDNEYEYFEVENGVIYENNEIYASEEAIELGFNVNVVYDKKSKKVNIYTLDGLSSVAVGKIGDAVVTEDIAYYNKKLLKYGLALIKNGNNDYGIQNYMNYHEGNYVLSCKYSDIKFVESLGCLIVTTSDTGEQGILKIDLTGDNKVETIIDPKYTGIYQITEDGTLYAIKENSKYGLLKVTEDENGVKAETILRCEYQTIGIEEYTQYEEMKSRYLINDKYIPIKKDDKWGLADRQGKVVIIPQFDRLGCSNVESGKPAMCIANLKNGNDAIIVGTITVVDEKNADKNITTYSIITVDSKAQKIGYDATEIYATYQNNEREYIMKIVASDGSIYSINVYDAYSEPQRNRKPTNSVVNDKNTTTQNNNATQTNVTSNQTDTTTDQTNTSTNGQAESSNN